MAFPTVEATARTLGTSASANKACNLPTGIVADSLLILVLRSAGADSHTTPTGWTALALNENSDASADFTSVWYRVADGSETSPVTVTATGVVKFAAVAWRVHNHNKATAPEISAVAVGTSTAPDSANLTPAGGPKDFLWASIAAYEGEQAVPPTFPASYSVGQIDADSGTGGAVTTNCRANIAGRQVNGSSENPGAYTISVSDDWTAWTLAVHPGTDPSTSPTRGRISWSELEVPIVPTRGRVSWSEFEVPIVLTRGRISWSEFELPIAPTRGRASWAEMEIPALATRGRVSFSEFEIPEFGATAETGRSFARSRHFSRN